MKKTLIYISIIFLFFNNSCGYAQTTIKLSKPHLELSNNIINIYYDILNSSQTDKFKIWIEITDSTGNKIEAHALNGDIGENVSGGNNKKITWDLTADNIYLNAGIYVQVNAEVLTPIEPVENVKPVSSISRGGTIFQSVLFPGWGLSRINKGKPHWLKGVAGYGCIAASIIYNKKAISSYDDYLNSDNIQDTETFYNKSVKEDNLSKVFAYSAIGIWVTDFIWTIAGSSKLKNTHRNNQARGFSISTVYEAGINVPLVVFRYNL